MLLDINSKSQNLQIDFNLQTIQKTQQQKIQMIENAFFIQYSKYF